MALLQESPPDVVRTLGRDPTRRHQPGYYARGRPRIPALELDQPTRLARTRPHKPLDLWWVSDKWWKLVTRSSNPNRIPTKVERRHFDVCLFSQIVGELKPGDLCIEGSDQYADYRSQLVPWTEYARDVAGYGVQLGLPVEGRAFVAHLKDYLTRIAAEADASFPANEYLRIEAGEPILGRLPRLEEPQDVKDLEQRIAERIEPLDILDVLVDTENWLNWTRFFGPISGHDAKIDASRARHVATAFCYGCNLGPSQTARSLEGYERRQIAWVDQRHQDVFPVPGKSHGEISRGDGLAHASRLISNYDHRHENSFCLAGTIADVAPWVRHFSAVVLLAIYPNLRGVFPQTCRRLDCPTTSRHFAEVSPIDVRHRAGIFPGFYVIVKQNVAPVPPPRLQPSGGKRWRLFHREPSRRLACRTVAVHGAPSRLPIDLFRRWFTVNHRQLRRIQPCPGLWPS
jgi:Tn3 transposase DDE domain